MDLFLVSHTLFANNLGVACILSAGFGVLSHVLYYVRGHRASQTVGILTFHIIAGSLLLIILASSQGILKGLLSTTIISTSYFAALFSSIVVYRIFFHPLRHFPGPFVAKISKLYNVWIAKDMHLDQTAWIEQYESSIIRIAPNELMLSTVDAQQKVHGAQARTSKKNTFYDFINYHGAANLDSILYREEHRWRRQVWDRAMNGKALERYESYAREVCHTWLDQVSLQEGKPINTSLYSLLIPFDNMGKMGYSTDFGTIKAGKADRMLHLIEVSFAAIGNIGQLTWPIAISKDLDLSPEQTEFERLACRVADEREKSDSDDKEDIMKYFLEDYRSEKPRAFFDRDILYSDSQAIMIAGTDTIAATLSFCFYYLARDPSLRASLREELATVFGKTIAGEFTQNDTSILSLLNSIIDETMRMHNAVGNNGARSTPPEGITVDGQHIPGNVTVFVGIHAMHRSPRYFKHPDEFIPERWTTRPDLVIDKRAFHPFLIGPFNCVGRRLALTVLRLALSYTVWHYDFEFAPGEDGTSIFTEARNQLIIKAGKLECVFKKRA